MPRRNFNIEAGRFQLKKDDLISCNQVPIGNGQAKFSCRLHKLGERHQPSFNMGDYEFITVEQAYSKIKNSVAFPAEGVQRPQVEFLYNLLDDQECLVSPFGDYEIAKILTCGTSRIDWKYHI